MLIDTHAHLFTTEFDEDRDAMLKRAETAGIGRIYLPNIDASTVDALLKLSSAYPQLCRPMMGLHPCSVSENVEDELRSIENALKSATFYAIGEIGLDYYWDMTYKEQQLFAFRRQLQWAKERQLPVAIHSRESTQECIDEVRNLQDGKLSGVFHCFSGTLEEARQIIDLGFYMGIGGVVTFKNSGLDKVVKDIDMAHLILETDAPYLSPVPYRGKRNESSYIKLIAEKIAEIKGLTYDEVADITTANARKLFKEK